MQNLLTKSEDDTSSKSTLISRNVTVIGRRTSIRLEPEMWRALNDIAHIESCAIHDICSLVYRCNTQEKSVTSAIRVFIMLYFKAAATKEGHIKAGHGNFKLMMRRGGLR